MPGVSSYLPFFIVGGSATVAIILFLAVGSLATGGRGRRKRFHWSRGPVPPLPDPALGHNPHEVQLRDPPPAQTLSPGDDVEVGPPPAEPHHHLHLPGHDPEPADAPPLPGAPGGPPAPPPAATPYPAEPDAGG